MTGDKREYPDTICNDCGRTHGKDSLVVSTYHKARCGWCGQVKSVTEPRDFGWPEFPPRKQ